MEWKNLTAWIRAWYNTGIPLLLAGLIIGLPLTGVPRVWVYAICVATGFLVGVAQFIVPLRTLRDFVNRPHADALTLGTIFLLLTSGYVKGMPEFLQGNHVLLVMLGAFVYSGLGILLSMICYYVLILFMQRRIVVILLFAAPALGMLTASWPFVPFVIGLITGLAIIRLAPNPPAPQVPKPEIQTLLQWLLPFTGAAWVLLSLLDQRDPLSHTPRIAAYATLVAMTGIILIIRPLQSSKSRTFVVGEQPGA